jgi:hypothetical protein
MPWVMWLLLGTTIFAAGMLIATRLQEFFLAGRERYVAQQFREIAERREELEMRVKSVDAIVPEYSYSDGLLWTAHRGRTA